MMRKWIFLWWRVICRWWKGSALVVLAPLHSSASFTLPVEKNKNGSNVLVWAHVPWCLEHTVCPHVRHWLSFWMCLPLCSWIWLLFTVQMHNIVFSIAQWDKSKLLFSLLWWIILSSCCVVCRAASCGVLWKHHSPIMLITAFKIPVWTITPQCTLQSPVRLWLLIIPR